MYIQNRMLAEIENEGKFDTAKNILYVLLILIKNHLRETDESKDHLIENHTII
jgi:hypothetical protein